jgi:hypothetical protein
MAESHETDYGTTFELTFKDQDDAVVDISAATTKTIKFKKPGGTVVDQDGAFVTDGTDGKLKYVAVDGDLDEDGLWSIQGYIKDAQSQYYSSIKRFQVSANLVTD